MLMILRRASSRRALAIAAVFSVSLASFTGAADARTSTSPHWSIEKVRGNGEAQGNVSCYTSVRCVAVSVGSRQVLTTITGGRSWMVWKGPPSAHLGFTSLECSSRGACLATATLGRDHFAGATILLSANGGRTWTNLRSKSTPRNASYRLNDVYCAPTRCLVTGTTGKTGFVLFSEDHDTKWFASRLPPQPKDGTLNGVTCSSASTCFALQGAKAELYRSSNGGATWTSVAVPAAFRPYETERGTVTGLTAISCGSPTFCVVGGFIAQPQLQGTTEPFKWVTNDGGVTWSFFQPFAATGAKSPSAISIGAISCVSTLDCELGLSYGNLYRTSDGGRAWRRDLSAPRSDSDVLSLSCVTLAHCVASVTSNFPSKKLLAGELWIYQ